MKYLLNLFVSNIIQIHDSDKLYREIWSVELVSFLFKDSFEHEEVKIVTVQSSYC